MNNMIIMTIIRWILYTGAIVKAHIHTEIIISSTGYAIATENVIVMEHSSIAIL